MAQALGYSDSFGALKKHVDCDDKQNCQNDSFKTPRGMTIINESGLYILTGLTDPNFGLAAMPVPCFGVVVLDNFVHN